MVSRRIPTDQELTRAMDGVRLVAYSCWDISNRLKWYAATHALEVDDTLLALREALVDRSVPE